ncbi:MAG: hypothetical protein JWN34_3407 [Bryobacterales bacterium]|nr:hypothetical protein [Bryobacterales bacterium]
MSAYPLPRLTPEQYLSIERSAEVKSEYYDGQMFAMSGGSLAHARLPQQITIALASQLAATGCYTSNSDMKIRVSQRGPFVYPDLTIICGDAQLADDNQDVLLNPTVVFEVLSPSSEAYDRGHKFAQYRQIPSLRDYVLVSQLEPRIEVFSRTQEDKWTLSEAVGLDATCYIPGVNAHMTLADVYRGISLYSQT